MADDDQGPSLSARRLGYGGLIPFLGLTAVLWIARPGDWPFASAALLGYGATIASFLGAIHWGLLMRPGAAQPLPALLWGVTPSLLDRVLYSRYQMQAWLPLRLWLTLTASSSCLAAVVALQR